MPNTLKSVAKQVVIDEKIRDLVFALNALGVTTTGSCEGHIDHRNALAPWIKITPTKSSREAVQIRKKIQELLNTFYKNRRVSSDIRIKTTNANVGFWLHNGGKYFSAWRREVNERTYRISLSKKIQRKNNLSARERARRKERLAIYQKEIILFSAFLKKLAEQVKFEYLLSRVATSDEFDK